MKALAAPSLPRGIPTGQYLTYQRPQSYPLVLPEAMPAMNCFWKIR